jgi:hypothetical protein
MPKVKNDWSSEDNYAKSHHYPVVYENFVIFLFFSQVDSKDSNFLTLKPLKSDDKKKTAGTRVIQKQGPKISLQEQLLLEAKIDR